MLKHATKGVHLLCEFTGCDPQVLASVDAVKTAVEEAASLARVTVLHGFYHRFTPLGVSGILCIAESHLSVHTWPELGYAAADVYTCGDHTLPRVAAEVLATAFRAAKNSQMEIARGERDGEGNFCSRLVQAPPGMVIPATTRAEPDDAGAPAPLVDGADPAQRHIYAVARRLADEHSDFHHIEICDTRTLGKVLSLDGAIQSSGLDEHVYHEALVHPAMLMHPSPADVLVLGGGEGASLREVLRHPSVCTATMVDIDGRLVELCARHLPEWSAGAFADPRSRIVVADGKAWVEQSTALFDVIVMDLTDQIDLGPSFPLYTLDFLRLLRRRLRPGGLLIVQAGELGPCEHFSHATIRRTLGGLFAQVWSYAQFVPSFAAEWSFVIATDAAIELPAAADVDAAVARRLPAPLRFLDGRTFGRMFTLSRETERMLATAGIVNVDRETFASARARPAAGGAAPPGFAPASPADVRALWQHYRSSPATFVIDIDGPEPELTEPEFSSLCTRDDSALYVLQGDGAIRGHMLLKDIDHSAGIATVHLGFAGECPSPGAPLAARLRDDLGAAMRARGIARAQTFLLDADAEKAALARAMGFVAEGCLRQQFRIAGRHRDLSVLARCDAGAAEPADSGSARPPLRRFHGTRRSPSASDPVERGGNSLLVARPVRANDAAQLRDWLREPVTQDLLDDSPMSDAALDAKVTRMLAQRDRECARSYVLQIGQRRVGLLCFLWGNADSRTAEIDLLVPASTTRDSLLVGRVLWTAGATAFDELDLHKIYAFVYGSNERCLRLLPRFMHAEAELRAYRPHGPGREAALVFGLLASEFRSLTSAATLAGP